MPAEQSEPGPNTTKCGREYCRSWAKARVRRSWRETRAGPTGARASEAARGKRKGTGRQAQSGRVSGRLRKSTQPRARSRAVQMPRNARAGWLVCLFVCVCVGAARACGRHESSLWLSASRRSRQSDPRSCGAAFMLVRACVRVFPDRAAGRATPNSLHPFHAALQCWAFVASRVAKTCLRQRFQQVRRQVEPRQVLE